MQVPQPGRMVDLHLKTIWPSYPSPSAYRDGEERAFAFFPLSNYLGSYRLARALSVHLFSLWWGQCRPLSVAPWAMGSLTGSLSTVSGQWGGDYWRTHHQEAWRLPSPQPTSPSSTRCLHIWRSGLESGASYIINVRQYFSGHLKYF